MPLVYITVLLVGGLWAGLLSSISPDGNGGRVFVLLAGVAPPLLICWWIYANGPY